MDPARLAAVGAEFRANGVAHVPAFLPPHFVSIILRRLDEYGEHVLPRLDDSHAFYPDPDDRASVNFIDFGGSPAAAPERGSSLAFSQHRPSAVGKLWQAEGSCPLPADHSFFLGMSARPRFRSLGVACLGEPLAEPTGNPAGRESEGQAGPTSPQRCVWRE